MSPEIDYKEINKVIKLMEEKNLSHFEIEVEGFKIKISRNQSPAPNHPSISQEDTEHEENEIGTLQNASFEEEKNNLYYITSPMVGIFYRAPDPSSSPFVEIGDNVKKSQTLCIIEAMKLMNEIESDVDGTLKEIYVKNGSPVEFGQKLFSIQPLQ